MKKHTITLPVNYLILAIIILTLSIGNKSLFSQEKAGLNENGERRFDIPCIVYQRFGDNRYPSENISPDVFREQMDFLYDNKYTVLTLGKALDLINSDKPVPEKCIILTVDGGYRSFITNCMPILREYRYNITVFINTINVGKADYLSWNDIRSLNGEGVEIGNNSHSNAYFLNVDENKRAEVFKRDAATAQRIFMENMTWQPDIYSYPFGEYNLNMKAVIEDMGFRAATARYPGIICERNDLFSLPRFVMGGDSATFDCFYRKIAFKAMRIVYQNPESPFTGTTAPQLELCLLPNQINENQIKCFIKGRRDCKIHKRPSDLGSVIVMEGLEGLHTRQTVYTLRAPMLNGKGRCWYSHLWINTQLTE